MNRYIARAMREATALTRGRKLGEATRLIQAVLSENRSLPRMLGWNGAPRIIDRTESVGQPDPSPESDLNATSLRLSRPEAQAGPNQPLRRSLGEVVKALRLAKLRWPSPNALPGLKPGAAAKIPEGAQFLSLSFSSPAGSREYKLYLPRHRSTGGLPLVVMLHGCTQDPDDFAIGTGMNDLAEEFGFLAAYPKQPASANPSSCWNWFAPKDQRRGAGEPSIIAGITREIIDRYALDPGRIFVAGLSAGGAMAAVMGATYPDLYSAIGVHSGLPYGAASDVPSAFAAMRTAAGAGRSADLQRGEHPGGVRAIVFHGEADQTVHPSNAGRIVAAHRPPDGAVTNVESRAAGGRSCTRAITRRHDGSIRVEEWRINGAGHAWSGGNPEGSYTDAAGPSASREMVRFFIDPPAAQSGDPHASGESG